MTDPSMRRPLGPVPRRLLGLYTPTFAISFAQGMVLLAVPTLAVTFHITPGLAAQIVTARAAGVLLALLPAGAFVDRLGPARVLLVGSLCIFAGAGVMLALLFWAVLLGQFLAGMGSSLWTAGREISGLELVRADQRGRLMSGFFGLQMAGLAIGPLAGGFVVDTAGLRALLLAHAAMAAVVLLITLLLERFGVGRGATDREAAEREAAGRGVAGPLLSFGTWRQIAPAYRATFFILVFVTFCMSLYRVSVQSLLPIYAGSSLGLPGTQVGALFGISSLGVIVMILPAGLVLDRVGRKWAAVPAAALPALAFAVMPLARTPLALAVLSAVFGLANGLSLGSMSTFSYDVIPEHARGRLQAMRRLVGDVGALAGPFLGGLIADAYGAAMAFLAYAPLLGAAALLLAFGTRETLTRRRTAAEAAGGS